jgi:hypothetical protein
VTIRVGIDYDEPIFPWYDYAHGVSIEAGLTTPEADPPTGWDPTTTYGCTLDEWIAVLDAEVDKGEHGMYGMPPKHESLDAINRFHERYPHVELYIATARGSFGKKGERIRELTRDQVAKFQIPVQDVVFNKDKGQIVQDLGLNYFLDDRPGNWRDAALAGAVSFLYDERWNQQEGVGLRVYSMHEFFERVEQSMVARKVLTRR